MGKTKRIKRLIKCYKKEIYRLQRNAELEHSNDERIRAQSSVLTYMSVCRDFRRFLIWIMLKRMAFLLIRKKATGF